MCRMKVLPKAADLYVQLAAIQRLHNACGWRQDGLRLWLTGISSYLLIVLHRSREYGEIRENRRVYLDSDNW